MATRPKPQKSDSKWPHSPYAETCAIFEKWGVDPTTVSIDGLDELGYNTIIRDGEGWKRLDAANRVIKKHNDWKCDEMRDEVLASYRGELLSPVTPNSTPKR